VAIQLPYSQAQQQELSEHYFVNVAPAPIFAGLERLNNRVFRPVKMLRRVLVLRRIAAAHMPAREAQPQVNPGVAHLEAFLAAFPAGRDFANFLDVLASCTHEKLLSRDSTPSCRTAERNTRRDALFFELPQRSQ
jgi:hypothetical protein